MFRLKHLHGRNQFRCYCFEFQDQYVSTMEYPCAWTPSRFLVRLAKSDSDEEVICMRPLTEILLTGAIQSGRPHLKGT